MMARDFGVSRAFIDKELHRLIAAGQLHCRQVLQISVVLCSLLTFVTAIEHVFEFEWKYLI